MNSTLWQNRQKRFGEADLYPVITESFCKGRSSLEILDAVLAAGCKVVQLREKEISKSDLYALARKYREKTAKANCLLIMNDHVDVALAAGADGVHLGQDDLPLEAARRIAPDLLIGISSHNQAEADEAIAGGAGYINIGPIFATGTKPEHKIFLGPDGMSEIAKKVDIPFSVMGGIKYENVEQPVGAGARIIAVVTAVTAASDPQQAATMLRERILTSRR